ncbi:hypothetical protein [Streptomyces sp. NPDC048442]|uniref:hypothetical protein n=1 Tax=Streptomyces sp. NPDC048442 TaxID=3154823 RepID=UPI00343D80D7
MSDKESSDGVHGPAHHLRPHRPPRAVRDAGEPLPASKAVVLRRTDPSEQESVHLLTDGASA